jgi:hypothetical protein
MSNQVRRFLCVFKGNAATITAVNENKGAKLMKIKMKKMVGIILSFALVLGLIPGMGLTAYAVDDPTYAQYKNTTTEITFDGQPWYLIDYDESTVTLLSTECVGASKYDKDGQSNTYSGSTVEAYVNDLYEEYISPDAKTAVSGNGAFLLTTEQASAIINEEVRKCSKASGAEYNLWWLCSPCSSPLFAACVAGDHGGYNESCLVETSLGVRPALKLNLESVIFLSESKTFTVGYNVTLSGGANATTSGGAISQTGLKGAMTTVTYTANTGYYFAEFADITDNGITAKRTSSTVVTVSGTPTADATITVPDAVTNDDTQQNPDGTKTVTKENADGKTITVTNYSKTDEQISQFVFEKAKGTTLDLTNVNSNTLKTVVVPESVKANGNTYKVTRIRKGFLKNCKQATKVDIGMNINTIDKNAFNYGKKVQKVVIRGKLKKVGKNAFKNTRKNVVIKVKTSAKNFEKNKKLLEKSGLPTNATIKRVKNKK